MARRVLLLVAVTVALLLGGCGGDDGDSAATTTATTTPAFTGATAPVVFQGETPNVKYLTNVYGERHEGFDRVVFEYRNGVPGYRVGYVEQPVRADGSGAKVEVSGSAVLVVRMDPALDADLEQPSAPRTYTGANRLTPEATAILEMVRVGGFESVLTWAVGIDGKRPFRVSHHESPPRVVIDVTSS
jgi:hypothetical protein